MKGALEVADVSLITISEMSWISVLGNFKENPRIPSLENDFKEIGRIAYTN